ncbi:MAG: carbohydrate ABC transporter substrate-binding protein [Roseburia sp.]|nr:carbohydrate ABC transporter substrate-binding protein [Roseburia sp.]
MKKRLVSLVLSLAMVASLFAGCGGSNNADANADANANNDAVVSTEDAATPAPAPATKITVAAFEGGYGADLWREVTAAYTEVTGVEVDLIIDKELENVIGPSMQGGEFPDVIHLATGRAAGLTEQFIKDNLITDITDVLSMTVPGESAKVSDKIAGGFTETALTNPYGDGKTYLAPMFYSPCGLFYNAGLLEEKGWAVPTTWDEMWALGELAKAEGIALFTYPTAGYFDAFLYALMYSVGGADFFNAATNYEEGVWDTAEGQKVFEILGKLASYTHTSTPAQANGEDFTKNQQLVLDNKAIFMPNGTWIVGEMAEAPRAEGFKWGMTALPAVEEGGDGYSFTWFEQAWIPAGAVNQDAAKQFVAFLYSDKACEIFAKYNAIQPVLGIADKLEGDNVMFYSIYDNGAKAAMGGFAPYASVAGLGTIQEVFFDPINSLVEGTMTVDQWIENIKAATDLMRENIVK